MSILSHAQPSARDSRFYLRAFAPAPKPPDPPRVRKRIEPIGTAATPAVPKDPARLDAKVDERLAERRAVVESILNPVHQHTALVKLQGPFTDRQLGSVADGILYLRRLGLVSILVVDSEDWPRVVTPDAQADVRRSMIAETMRVTEMLEERGARARPFYEPMLRFVDADVDAGACPVEVEQLAGLRGAIENAEIPVLPAFAVDTLSQRSSCVSADDALRAFAHALGHPEEKAAWLPSGAGVGADVVPVRMLIINREGGIPSPARGGNPHLMVNLESEHEHIRETFVWHDTHATALRNLELVRACLAEMPPTSSAVIVSHRSPKSLVANLITNRPAFSPSLHHSLLPSAEIKHTPTIIRRGRVVRVVRAFDQLDLDALTTLLEQSFGHRLDRDAYFERLRGCLDYVIIAGDYDAAAIVTAERGPADGPAVAPVSYLDKFAVLPSLQGDGTVDFLWGALRDESFGLGLLDALNPNGGKGGYGKGIDLVWRSRAGNPVNRWYFERSSGFSKIEMGRGGTAGLLYWCDAEDRVERLKSEATAGITTLAPTLIADEERGRLAHWAEIIGAIPSCWLKD